MRRSFLTAIAAMMLTCGVSAKEFLVYFATFTNELSKGIYVSRLDAETGRLSPPELAAETPSPCFLAISPDGRVLYSDNNVENFNGQKASAVSAFAIDRKSGRLTLINQKGTGGPGACYVGDDAPAHVLLVANYADGSVKSFQLNPDGSIGADGTYIHQHGSGVNASRQTAPHAHFFHADPSGRFALMCDLGTDKVTVYRVNSADGTLAENSIANVPPGSGARHLAFSPDGKFVHVINEMGCTVTTFAWDGNAGKLQPIETVSVLPPGVAADPGFTAAEILAVGDHVYVTVRTHDSISVLTADPQTGRLTFLQNVPSGGKFPRGLGIDPTGRWLIVGNQKTDNAVEYAINPQTGKISPTGQELKMGSPVDVEFIEAR